MPSTSRMSTPSNTLVPPIAARYDIKAVADSAHPRYLQSLSKERLTWQRNSPDTLKEIAMSKEQLNE